MLSPTSLTFWVINTFSSLVRVPSSFQAGTFQMTTISLGSAFEGMGNANSGYKSKTFEKFVNSLEGFRQRVEAQYAGAVYPAGSATTSRV